MAALLLAMGKPAAGRLLKHFDSAELKEIARAASGLGTIPASELEVVIEEFADQFAAGMSLLGTAQEVEKLLTGILPTEQISEVMADVLNQKAHHQYGMGAVVGGAGRRPRGVSSSTSIRRPRR